LGGVPTIGSHELNEARDRAVTLELTNRFAQVEGDFIVCRGNIIFNLSIDPHAIEKALWVQAKRSVLAILRVQPAKDLIESLMQPVAEEHESMWEEIIERDLMADELRHHERRMPSTTAADAAYRLEDIQSWVVYLLPPNNYSRDSQIFFPRSQGSCYLLSTQA
jgi:Ras GTPase-activating-like protein IQGAP2/3